MSLLGDPKRTIVDTTDMDAGEADALPLDHGTDTLRHLIGLEDDEEKAHQAAPAISSVSGHRHYGGGGLGVGSDTNSISINNASSSQLAVTPSPMAEATRTMGDRFGQQALQHANANIMSVTVGHIQHPQQQQGAQGAHGGNGVGQQGFTPGQRQGSGQIATPLARLGSGSLLAGGDGSGSERFSLHLQGGVQSNATTPHHATMLMYQQQHGLAVGAFPSAGVGFGTGSGHTAAVPSYSTFPPAGPTYLQNMGHNGPDNTQSSIPSVPTIDFSPNLNIQTNPTAAPPYYHQNGSVMMQGIPLSHTCMPSATPSAHFMSVPSPLISSSAAHHTAALQQSSTLEQQVGATFTNEDGCDNLFIANISNDVDDELLIKTFEPFGEILSAKVMLDIHTGRSRGFGFVMYTGESSGAAAMRALHNTPLGERGQRMSVTKAQTSGRSAITETTKLYVRNVPVHLQEQALREHFAQYGVIRRFARKEDTASKNDASKQALKQSLPPSIVIFLEYATVKEAQHAVKAIHGKKPWPGMAIPLLAKTAETTENRNVRRERQRQKVDDKRSQPTEDGGLNRVFLASGSQPAIGGLPYLQQSQVGMDPSLPLYINNNVAVGYSTSVSHAGLGIDGMSINVNNGQHQQQQPSVAVGGVGVAQNINFHSNPSMMTNGRPQIDLNAMYGGAGASLAHLPPHSQMNNNNGNNNNGNASTMTNYSPSHTQSFAPSPTNAATPFHMRGNNASGFMSFGALNADFGSGPSHVSNIGASSQQAHHSTVLTNVQHHQQQGGGAYMYPSTQQMPYIVGPSSQQQIDTSQLLGGLASPSLAGAGGGQGGGGGNDSSMHITVGSTPPLLTPTNAQQHQHQHYQQQRLGSGGGGGGGGGGYFYQQQQLSSQHTGLDSSQTGMHGMGGFSGGAMGTMGGMTYNNKLPNTNSHTPPITMISQTSGGMLHLAHSPISSSASAPAPPRYSPASTPTHASGQQALHQQLRLNQFQYQSQQQIHLQQQAYQQQQHQQQVPPSYGETVGASGAFHR